MAPSARSCLTLFSSIPLLVWLIRVRAQGLEGAVLWIGALARRVELTHERARTASQKEHILQNVLEAQRRSKNTETRPSKSTRPLRERSAR